MKKWDCNFSKQLFADINVTSEIVIRDYQRFGKPSSPKNRPIKIVFNSAAEKEVIMKHLKYLKCQSKYTGLSVTNDLTKLERETFSSMAKMAKEKSSADSKYFWRVRGSPKNGLFFKKFEKSPVSLQQ